MGQAPHGPRSNQHQRFYEAMADQMTDRDFVFYNYGYAPTDAGYGWIDSEDWPVRHHLCLAGKVLQGVDLGGKRVLEIGSGRGGNCDFMLRYGRAGEVFGLDRCWAGVRFSRRRFPAPRLAFLNADASCLPFSGGGFDVVLCLESSHSYPRLDRFLSEVHRVLSPGGILCYADLWFLEVLPFDWEARQRSVQEADFEWVRHEDISEGVFRALKSSDSLPERMKRMANPRNRMLVEHAVKLANAVRYSLAAAQCSYLVWQLRKK